MNIELTPDQAAAYSRGESVEVKKPVGRGDTVSEKYGITYYLTAEDERYPKLVLQGDFGSTGYDLNKETGELRRVCLCAARCPSECCCGAWDTDNLNTN